MRCIIVEDQVPAQRLLQHYVGQTEGLQLCGTFADPDEAKAFLKAEAVDLMFLDIHLPRLSGIELLRHLERKPSVVLTTAYEHYAVESYELEVADYLLKPFSLERFQMAVDRARRETELRRESQSQELMIKSGHSMIQVDLREMRFIHSVSDYTELHMMERRYLSGDTLKQWEDRLAQHRWVRIHKSYLVNLHHVHSLSGKTLRLQDGAELPVGRAFRPSLKEAIGIG